MIKYAVYAHSYRNDGVIHTLCECETYNKAKQEKEAFIRTRHIEFPVIWIVKLED